MISHNPTLIAAAARGRSYLVLYKNTTKAPSHLLQQKMQHNKGDTFSRAQNNIDTLATNVNIYLFCTPECNHNKWPPRDTQRSHCSARARHQEHHLVLPESTGLQRPWQNTRKWPHESGQWQEAELTSCLTGYTAVGEAVKKGMECGAAASWAKRTPQI